MMYGEMISTDRLCPGNRMIIHRYQTLSGYQRDLQLEAYIRKNTHTFYVLVKRYIADYLNAVTGIDTFKRIACVVKTYPSIDPIVAPPDIINI